MTERVWTSLKIATLLNRSVDTVRSWRCDKREIPDHALQVLEGLANRERRAVGV